MALWIAGVLAHAEQADHVGAVGMETQAAVGQGAGIGGEEGRALLVLGLAVGAADMGALVADQAHQLAAAVLEDRRADMGADGEVEAAQVVLAVAVDREAAQLHDAAAVFELVGNVVPQLAERRQPDVFGRDLRPFHAAQALHGGVELLDGVGGQVADPAGGVLDVLALPDGGPGQRRAMASGAHGANLSSPTRPSRKWVRPEICAC